MDNSIPIPVAVQGWTWSSSLLSILIGLVAGIFGAMIKVWPTLKKVAADREANLLTERAEEMSEMRKEIKDLTARLDKREREHVLEIAAAKKLIEDERDLDRLRMDGERAIYRHEVGNLKHAFSSLLMLLKKGVAVEDAVAEIEQLRNEQLARECAEKATFNASLAKAKA